MSELNSFGLLNEGQVTLPEGYQDRTVNIFTSFAKDAPSFTVSRDSLGPNEALAAYIDRQLAQMQQHLKQWQQSERCPATLGENLSHGEIVHGSYQRSGRQVWQQQAVFNPQGAHILVFTMTATVVLTEADSVLFHSLLKSFRPHA